MSGERYRLTWASSSICNTKKTCTRKFSIKYKNDILGERLILFPVMTKVVTRLTGRVPLVEHELLTLPGLLSSPPVSSGIRVTRSLIVCEMFWFSFDHLGLSVLWFTDSDYSFGIFKLFLQLLKSETCKYEKYILGSPWLFREVKCHIEKISKVFHHEHMHAFNWR